MSEEETNTSEIEILYLGVQVDAKYRKLHVYQEITVDNVLVGKATYFAGRKALRPASPGAILTANAIRDKEGIMQTIHGRCTWSRLHPDLEFRSALRLEHDATLLMLRLKRKSQENPLVEQLAPLRKIYAESKNPLQRRALLATVIEYITR